MAWTWEKINQKARFLSLLTDSNAATDDQVYERIDDFVLYDMPNNIQIDILRRNIRFVCNPYVGRYTLDETSIITELVDFDQKYSIIDQPMYCAGYTLRFYQDKSIFDAVFQNSITIKTIGSGNGALAQFTATLSHPIEPYSVLISSQDANSGKIVAVDRPDNEDALQRNNPATGTWRDSFDENANVQVGTINYITGEIDVTFNTIPANGAKVEAQFQQYNAARPQALLYYNSEFHLRPIPDQPYIIEFQAQVRPSASDRDNVNNTPELNEWGEYIAYGAALKLLADKSNNERMQIIEPKFRKLEDEMRTRTQRQGGTKRTYTPFAQQAEDPGAPWDTRYNRRPY